MAICGIIALELAILYLGFWFIFLRKPKDYKVDQPIWGVYEDHADELYKHDSTVLVFSARSEHGAELVGPNESSTRTNKCGPKAA
jgi:hypothetical protein